MPKKSEVKATRVRNGIIAFVAAVVILVIGYGMLYSTGVTQGEFVAGDDYRVLEAPERRRPGQPIEVREFFSYGCIHCKNFDPQVEQWQEGMPDGVSFARTPVSFSPTWRLMAQTYFALEELGILAKNHERLFRAVHDRRVQFLSAEQIADFVDGNGASGEEFLEAFNGQAVRREMRNADTAQSRVGITSVPTLVVGGKYVVTMDRGAKVALEIVDHLISLEKSGGETAAPEGIPEETGTGGTAAGA